MSQSKEDDLKLGSITEVWTSREQWLKYCQYLDNMAAEAYDSEGVPIKLSRYALFLKVWNLSGTFCILLKETVERSHGETLYVLKPK